MASADADLTQALAAAARREAEARAAVRDALARTREAVREQTRILRILKSQGMRLSAAAFHIARALGLKPTPALRQRLAAAWRQRLHRAGVTAGHGDLSCHLPPEAASRLSQEEARMKRDREENPMGKLVKRTTTTVTEELVEPGEDIEHDAESIEADDDDPEVEPEQEDEPAPVRRHRRE